MGPAGALPVASRLAEPGGNRRARGADRRTRTRRAGRRATHPYRGRSDDRTERGQRRPRQPGRWRRFGARFRPGRGIADGCRVLPAGTGVFPLRRAPFTADNSRTGAFTVATFATDGHVVVDFDRPVHVSGRAGSRSELRLDEVVSRIGPSRARGDRVWVTPSVPTAFPPEGARALRQPPRKTSSTRRWRCSMLRTPATSCRPRSSGSVTGWTGSSSTRDRTGTGVDGPAVYDGSATVCRPRRRGGSPHGPDRWTSSKSRSTPWCQTRTSSTRPGR